MQQILNTQSSQGYFEAVREKDILSTALGNKEHPGRMRGLGVNAPWSHGFADDYFTHRSRKRSKTEHDDRLEHVLTTKFQRQITRLQDQMNQLLNQSQAAPVILGASPPRHQSSVASTNFFDHDDVQLPIDDIKVMYVSEMLQR